MSARPVTPASPRGLPERLPAGERLLWQGAPDVRALLLHTFHIRAVALYFAIILAWCALTIIGHGGPAHAMRLALLHRAELAVVPFVLMAAYAWSIRRSTTYSITNRRVVISFGIALPMTFNLPFSRIEAAGLRLYRCGAGDIPLRLQPGETLSYFVVWPHARPWRMARAEPMLRCVAGAEAASAILGEALTEYEASTPVRVVAQRPVRLRAAGAARRAVAAE